MLQNRSSAQNVAEFLSNFNSTAEVKYYESVVAEWEYNTDITDETQAEAVCLTLNLFKAKIHK